MDLLSCVCGSVLVCASFTVYECVDMCKCLGVCAYVCECVTHSYSLKQSVNHVCHSGSWLHTSHILPENMQDAQKQFELEIKNQIIIGMLIISHN